MGVGPPGPDDASVLDHSAPHGEEGRALWARTPVTLEVPDGMRGVAAEVLAGEYESGYSGEGLTIVDIGANVGAFAVWATLRWPSSTIHSYEPHPGTFQILARNARRFPGIACHQQAVYPGSQAQQPFCARYPGDGEGGLLSCVAKTFAHVAPEDVIPVSVIAPDRLPVGDVVKIDVEGAEADILDGLSADGTSLILLEYQNAENRRRIKARLAGDFACVYEDSWPWSAILPGRGYRSDLAGDEYGHLFFANRRTNKLHRVPLPESATPHARPLRQLLAELPGAARNALRRRLRRGPR
jgi:FkbM family methyltransferase